MPCIFRHLLWFLFLTVVLVPGFGYCQGGFDDDDDMVFSSAPEELDEGESTGLWDRFNDDSIITLGYRFSHTTGDDPGLVDNHGFVRLEYDTLIHDRLFFKLDGKLSLYPKTDHIADSREKSLVVDPSVKELYFQMGSDRVSFKLGKQIMIWGKADTVAITDVVSPRDRTDFIFQDLEDARNGNTMLSADIYTSVSDVTLFVSPMPDQDDLPDKGTQYYRQTADPEKFVVAEDEPGWGDWEFGIKADKDFEKAELSLMAGRFRSNLPILESEGGIRNSRSLLAETYPEYLMIGGAGIVVLPSVIFKGELAYKTGFGLQAVREEEYTLERQDLVDMAVGAEYNANDRYQLTLELSNRYLISEPAAVPGVDRNHPAAYVTWTKDFFNQTLEAEYNHFLDFNHGDMVQGIRLTYDWTDTIEIETRYHRIRVRDSESWLRPFQDEDRITLDVRKFF